MKTFRKVLKNVHYWKLLQVRNWNQAQIFFYRDPLSHLPFLRCLLISQSLLLFKVKVLWNGEILKCLISKSLISNWICATFCVNQIYQQRFLYRKSWLPCVGGAHWIMYLVWSWIGLWFYVQLSMTIKE